MLTPLSGGNDPTGKIVVAVQAIIAVSLCTAKKSLSCAANITHGKHKKHGNEKQHGILSSGARQRTCARQSLSRTHGKETHHGKDPAGRTATKCSTAKGLDVAVALPLPCGQPICTAKAPLSSESFFAVRHHSFYFFSFNFISSNIHIYFLISFTF
jgi:hypothetical protein